MFTEIGKKLKTLAVVSFIVVAVLSFIGGIGLMTLGDYFVAIGMLAMLLGAFIGLIMAWLLYGFGELIDKTRDIERNTRGKAVGGDNERLSRLMELKNKGLITEEEYSRAMNKEQ